MHLNGTAADVSTLYLKEHLNHDEELTALGQRHWDSFFPQMKQNGTPSKTDSLGSYWVYTDV